MAVEENKNLLEISEREQYQTINELLAKSKPSTSYYTLLVLSAFIVACGLLLNNASIVIGGMLVTPVLTPVLVVALALSTGETGFLKNGILLLIIKSFLIVFAGSLIMAFIFGASKEHFLFENTIKTASLYFIVAVASGVAATLAWTRKEISEVLPGISIAVSLVVPTSLVGVSLASFNFEAVRFYFLVFVFNLLGIIMGSIIVFSLLKFYRAGERLHRENISRPEY
ncbi:MAG: DUF389 domain-containing protein [bacterium]